jgi:hypothetical protein
MQIPQELAEKINTLTEKINGKFEDKTDFDEVLEIVIEAGISHVEGCLKGISSW